MVESEPAEGLLAHDVRHAIQVALAGLELARVEGKALLEVAREGLESALALLSAALETSAEPALPHPITKDVFFVLDLACYDSGADSPLLLDVQASPFIAADRWIVRRALLNVVLNARAASPHGGAVTIQVREENGSAVVRVRDHGSGISREDLERIAAGETLPRDEGHGMGLLGSAKAIAAIGGRLELESSAGRGTIATLRLPAIERAGLLGHARERSSWNPANPRSTPFA